MSCRSEHLSVSWPNFIRLRSITFPRVPIKLWKRRRGARELMTMMKSKVIAISITVRFAGDSGDGMQLTGDQFTDTTAVMGNDFATLPDYPAEIRAPAGTLPGVSSFQLQFSENIIFTPGDKSDVLVAMNPAALKVN